MRRVVVTGMGIVSSIGNNAEEVLTSLREARSGVVFAEEYAKLGFRSQVHGAPTCNAAEIVDRRAMRFHGGGTAWAHVAMEQAIADSGLEAGDISNERTGLIVGSGGPSTRSQVEAADITRSKGPKKVGPFVVPKAMCSTASATLSTWFKIRGTSYSISSACSTSSHCIGNAAELIQWGKQDVVFAGGCEELDWTLSVLFDAMGAMSSSYNDRPATASREERTMPCRAMSKAPSNCWRAAPWAPRWCSIPQMAPFAPPPAPPRSPGSSTMPSPAAARWPPPLRRWRSLRRWRMGSR